MGKLGAKVAAENAGPAAKADTALRRLALERINGLVAWIDPALKRYSKEQPLRVLELSGAEPRVIEVFAGRNRGLYIVEGGAIRWRNWTSLKPAYFGALVVGVLLDAPSLPPREMLQGAEIFAQVYGLPEMESALRQGSVHHLPQ
jgi:hypothetical protein